jgi:tetratricopeptide (TPR) repeat protein
MEFSQFDDNHNLSLTKFESMLKTNSVLFFDSNEFENIIEHYLEIGKIALAKRAIKLGLAQHPTSVNLRLYKVEVFVFENKFDEANDLLQELHALEPRNEEIYIQKANIYSKTEQHEKAIQLFEEALKYTENPADIYSLLGMEYLFMDKFEEAKLYFMMCLDQDFEDYSALYNIMYCFDYLDQNEEAIKFLTRYLDQNPYCEVAWHQLGKQYSSVKKLKKALTAFDFAIYSDDTFIGAYLEKGKVLEQLHQYNEAIENYKISLALDDPTSFALLRIGKCYEKLKQHELAVTYYYKTVEEDPLLDKGWIAITNFYFKQHDFKNALFYINKAINIDEENAVYWKLYGQICRNLEHFKEAELGYKKALDLGNYELDTYIARADILTHLKNYAAAISNLNEATEFYPSNEAIEFRLAGLNFKINNSVAAHRHLKKAIQISSDHLFIVEELFPQILKRPSVQKIIAEYKNTSS